MRFVAINSSSLAGLSYNPDNQELVAQFARTGEFYKYKGVDGGTVLSILFEPGSQGGAFNTKIVKGGYVSEKLEGNPND